MPFNSNKYFCQSMQNAYDMCRIEEILSKVYLKSAITDAMTEEAEGDRLSFGVCSVQGWRKYQEDSHIAIIDFDEDTSLFAVFDGHSGPEVAIYASEKLPDLIKSNKLYQMGQIEEALRQVFMTFDALLLTKNVNNQLFEIRKEMLGENMSPNDKPGFTSGCTALLVLVVDDLAYVANIGDSRSVLSRNGKTISMSTDHKPDDRAERKRIERSGGHVIDGRINGGLNLSRAFGDHQYKRNKRLSSEEQMVIAYPDIKVKRLKIKRDDFLVLACDGVWNCMSNQKVVSFVNKRIKNQSLVSICQELTHKCMSPVRPLNGIGGDNITVIVVKFERE